MIGKKVLVWGMARSGIHAAKLASDAGAKVRINDLKSAEQIGSALDVLKTDGIEWRLAEPIEQVLEGMDILVISPGIPYDLPAVQKAKDMGIEVIGEIELAYRLGQGHIIGITGTNGKTTTTSLLGAILENAGKITHVVGNIGIPYSASSGSMKPDDYVACELSSFQLESTVDFRPEIAAVLNLTEDHLNRHKTMQNYADIKMRIFEKQDKSNYAVLNYDDEFTRAMAGKIASTVIWFSRTQKVEKGAFIEDGVIVFADEKGAKTNVCRVEDVYIPGPHNLENALAATACAMCAGIPSPVIRHTLRTFRGVEHRIETVRILDGVKYINDSKGTNPDSTIKAIQTMLAPTVIILGGSEKNSDFTEMCRILKESFVRYAVLIGKTGERIGETLEKVGFTDYEYVGYDFEKAINVCRNHAEEGGNVLLSPACASFDMFEDYEARGREFKRIVNALKEAEA
ncbi:MAG: UDP-N-acetylmuramoyl-L-alanine--D-glutamate ligase [Clostridia bacterium]|nr:UDP-N-acetylmuramoyl-L-alanine--D-glutamate ligase [Clostridia bacterium]